MRPPMSRTVPPFGNDPSSQWRNSSRRFLRTSQLGLVIDGYSRSRPAFWNSFTASVGGMETQKLTNGERPSNVAQIFQPLLDDSLLGLVHLRRLVPQQLSQDESQKFLQAAEPRGKAPLGIIAEFGRQTHVAQLARHQAFPSAP